MATHSLRTLLDGAPPHTMVCHKVGEEIQAIITTRESGFWARIYVGGSAAEGNCLREDVAGLVALLAAAGIPVEAGWEKWQTQTQGQTR